MGKPLVTFAMFVYNQERFIRESILGALAQTYSPLQIVISDDCSTDRTFDIVNEMLSGYAGPHEILLNRNEKNLGIGAHVNRIMQLSNGEFIVIAAGDDISLPERTTVLAEKWIELGKGPISLHSSVIRMDINGNNCRLIDHGIVSRLNSPHDMLTKHIIMGASHAWSKKIFEIFGDLNESLVEEDQAIGLRASLLGGVYFIDQPLIKHREGGISFYITAKNRSTSDVLSTYYERAYGRYLQHVTDLGKLENLPRSLIEIAQKRAKNYRILFEVVTSSNPYKVLWTNKCYVTIFIFRHSIGFLFPRIRAFYLILKSLLVSDHRLKREYREEVTEVLGKSLVKKQVSMKKIREFKEK